MVGWIAIQGAVDGGSVPLLPQPDDAGDHPGLPGPGGRRGDDGRHGPRRLPGRLPAGLPHAPRGGEAGREVRRGLPGVQARDTLHRPAAAKTAVTVGVTPRHLGQPYALDSKADLVFDLAQAPRAVTTRARCRL